MRYNLTCLECGNAFESIKPQALFCESRCRQQRYRRRINRNKLLRFLKSQIRKGGEYEKHARHMLAGMKPLGYRPTPRRNDLDDASSLTKAVRKMRGGSHE